MARKKATKVEESVISVEQPIEESKSVNGTDCLKQLQAYESQSVLVHLEISTEPKWTYVRPLRRL